MANVAFIKDVYGDNYEIISVKSASTLDDGMVLVANTLSTAYDEGDVYVGTTPVANTDGGLVIVCAEEFYQDQYGNRVNITDPTKIDYPAGTVVRAFRPAVGRKFAISTGAITGTTNVGQYIIPTAGSTQWTASATIPANVKFALLVEYKGNISSKGNAPITGIVGRVVVSNPV